MNSKYLAVFILLFLFGCSTAPPPRTPAMASVGVERTTAELRYEIYQYLAVFAATVHSAADEIVSTETDREIREMAIAGAGPRDAD